MIMMRDDRLIETVVYCMVMMTTMIMIDAMICRPHISDIHPIIPSQFRITRLPRFSNRLPTVDNEFSVPTP